MIEIINYLEFYIVPLGALGVLLASFIEEIIIPIPSAIVMMASGFLLLRGGFSLSFIYQLIFTIGIPSTLGVTLGSLVIYFIGFWGGKNIIDKWGKWFGFSWQDLENFQNKVGSRRVENLTLFISRATPFLPSTIVSFFCGFIRQKLSTYLLITISGIFIRSIILALIGWYVGDLYREIANFGGYVENSFIILVLIVVLFVFYKRKKLLKIKTGNDTI